MAALVTLVGALLAAVISGTNLTFELWPGLKPDPKAEISADLAILAFDRNVNRGEHRTRLGEQKTTRGRPDDPGNVFYLRAHIEGFKRESLTLRWFTYTGTGSRLPKGPKSSRSEEEIFRPEAPINTQVAQVFVDSPRMSREYFVRFELYSGSVLLAFVDSTKFSIELL